MDLYPFTTPQVKFFIVDVQSWNLLEGKVLEKLLIFKIVMYNLFFHVILWFCFCLDCDVG